MILFCIILFCIILFCIRIISYATYDNCKTHLVAFADSKYKNTAQRLYKEAIEFNKFNSINIYDENDDSINEHLNFISNNERGFGYWIWKPCIILKTMNKIDWNDVLVYVDIGCSFNNKGIPRFNEYINMVKKSENGMLVFELEHLEKNWTKRYTSKLLDCESECLNSGQIISGIIFIKKTKFNIDFISLWLEKMTTNNYSLLVDDYSEKHRHDQSILSILVKKYHPNAIVLKDETYEVFNGDFKSENAKKYPIHATRLKY